MRKIILYLLLIVAFLGFLAKPAYAVVKTSPTASPSASPTFEPTPLPTPVPDLTQKTQETLGPLEKLLEEQKLGPVWPSNPLKHAIRGAVETGVPANTIVLLLLLPLVATIIAAARHLVGLRGFGIFLPAALSVVFVATRPVVGIGLFLIIVTVSTLTRMLLRRLKIKLQYLPRMALILWIVSLSVLGVLFAAPVIRHPDLTNVSIFPILIMALLAEDFIRVQLGKSIKTAINLTTETLILALVSYFFLTLKVVQEFALLNPEWYLLGLLGFDYILGKYVGLRILEIWRFRKLIKA
ncbi:hypothetical protein A3E46_01425 [Candidatus Woesebacteria bacterium RIFCSPHIGHO2_12_FULL_46_16]|uniref:7 transmembrane helices usually fused to an inactive transglutaminase domain-containing protein n=1 Tax=Candidatus Woesebacteria bacterium RIFCSPHIGHO2_12_FULL_46_16 TaxID=1802513 RepID=A0A1F8AWI7_9BACT|nr:MAG: hypothetical protein A3E46_01425 [Candidatus Woesebacteria bacterium RIFCSPHIGHO2_12_FULL_46_16]